MSEQIVRRGRRPKAVTSDVIGRRPGQLNRWALFLRRRMNRVAIIEQAGNPRFDIVVDGRRLAEHFAGRQGSHPVELRTFFAFVYACD